MHVMAFTHSFTLLLIGVGVDSPSLDYGQTASFSVHQLLQDKNIYLLENVADTSMLPAGGQGKTTPGFSSYTCGLLFSGHVMLYFSDSGVTLIVGSMKIDYGSGYPHPCSHFTTSYNYYAIIIITVAYN